MMQSESAGCPAAARPPQSLTGRSDRGLATVHGAAGWVAAVSMLVIGCSSPPANTSCQGCVIGADVNLFQAGDGAGPDVASKDMAGADTLATDSVVSDAAAETQAAKDSAVDPDAPDWAGLLDDTAGGDSAATSLDSPGGPTSNCNARAKIVYLVTKKKQLVSFDPEKMKLTLVGTLNCPGATGTPFSMSVDRNADAWVLYTGGGLSMSGGGVYKVSTLDASCEATGYVPAGQGMELFGMGFAANTPGSQDETLYILGNTAAKLQKAASILGAIALPSMAVSKGPTLDTIGGADLTGNGNGELFGFFAAATPPSVRKIDLQTGKTTAKVWPLPADALSSVTAWAFAQWGGTFYLFVKDVLADSSDIWLLDAATGKLTVLQENIGYTVTGAGVSSCAPTQMP